MLHSNMAMITESFIKTCPIVHEIFCWHTDRDTRSSITCLRPQWPTLPTSILVRYFSEKQKERLLLSVSHSAENFLKKCSNKIFIKGFWKPLKIISFLRTHVWHFRSLVIECYNINLLFSQNDSLFDILSSHIPL